MDQRVQVPAGINSCVTHDEMVKRMIEDKRNLFIKDAKLVSLKPNPGSLPHHKTQNLTHST